MEPKISVIVPIYNAELYLEQCIESVLNQTMRDIELQKDFKPNDRVESLLCLTGLDECKVKTLEDCRINVNRDFNFADDQIRKQYIKTNQYFERVLNEDGRSF